ncbi:hypothetical protein IWT140_00464 [Secundilactobacillus pentosiphilus]|uniref:Uncharacterized protein n=1 Tax=Secundilactobacillus pentosiphilus TaxID=1714682 RepID=A0A1Z5IMD7_9LACO|nr:hypothetical protein [Secundilactobacillus pentosiphilus]GAX02866.1 hypothetical protein IWT140_00464 [Secundilactobacillus pentosiphilus]
MFRNFRYWGSVIAGLVIFQIFVGLFKHVGKQLVNTEIFSGWITSYEKMVHVLSIYLVGDYFILVLLVAGVIIWFVVDYKSGQLHNDYIAWNFGRMLQKTLPESNDSSPSSSDDRTANHFLKKCKIVKYNNQLSVIIPCGRQAVILQIIKDRCNRANATIWLDGCYSNIHFKEAKSNRKSMSNEIIFQQK